MLPRRNLRISKFIEFYFYFVLPVRFILDFYFIYKLINQRLIKIVELAETVPALNDQLEKLEEIYLLVKNEND